MAFRPKLIPSVATLLLLSLLLALGFWQLDRARQKERLQEAFAEQAALPYLPIASLDLADTEIRYRKVIIEGHYDSEHQILLDNQIQNGRPGYHVYTPLRIKGWDQGILVNRGWMPLGESRQRLPDIAVTAGPLVLRGRIGQPANPGLRLGDTPSSTWPQVVQHVDYQRLAEGLGYPLASAVILLDPEEPYGYRREWQPAFGGFGPERHKGYALQWFSLAAALTVIYLVVNTRRNGRVKDELTE